MELFERKISTKRGILRRRTERDERNYLNNINNDDPPKIATPKGACKIVLARFIYHIHALMARQKNTNSKVRSRFFNLNLIPFMIEGTQEHMKMSCACSEFIAFHFLLIEFRLLCSHNHFL